MTVIRAIIVFVVFCIIMVYLSCGNKWFLWFPWEPKRTYAALWKDVGKPVRTGQSFFCVRGLGHGRNARNNSSSPNCQIIQGNHRGHYWCLCSLKSLCGAERAGVEPSNPGDEIATYRVAGLGRCPTAPHRTMRGSRPTRLELASFPYERGARPTEL